MTFCGLDGDLIPRVSVSDHAHAGVCRQDTFQPLSGFGRAVGHDDLACMLRISPAYTAAMME